jgi:CRP/FNR family transcriptional regulator
MTELQQISEFEFSPELIEELYANSIQKTIRQEVLFRMKIPISGAIPIVIKEI